MFGILLISPRAAMVGLGAIIAIALGIRVLEHGPERHVVSLGGEIVVVELANTPELREKGLSGRDRLEPGTGMLFIFPHPSRAGFWMKDMGFAIDIIWINQGSVVDIASGIVKTDPLVTYYPRLPADLALEVEAGFAKRTGLKIGDPVEIKI